MQDLREKKVTVQHLYQIALFDLWMYLIITYKFFIHFILMND